MIKQTIHFTDYNDQPREVIEYFHLSESEIVDMQAHSPMGIEKELDNAIKSNDVAAVLDFIKNLVHKSYGRKSADGLHFHKSPEILNEFINSAYYSDFLLGLIENDGARGVEFIQGIMPKKLLDRALQQVRGESVTPPETRIYAPSAREQADINRQNAQTNALGQPQPEKTEKPADPAPMSAEELQEFMKWRQSQQNQTNFRVPTDEDVIISRPVHEQHGDAQP